jgi:hypothetical protein
MLIRILKTIYDFLHDFGKARAAAHFARIGDYKTAQAIMNVK